MSGEPLPNDRDAFITEHHNLVYRFLNAKGLPISEYYDVVIFGYLKAVDDYLTKERLKSYSFTTIAWRDMERSLCNEYKSKFRQKRNAIVISIDDGRFSGGLSLEQCVPPQNDLMQDLEMKLLLHDLAGRVSEQQMDMVRQKSDGYGVREIARKHQTTMKRVTELLEEVRTILLDMCYE